MTLHGPERLTDQLSHAQLDSANGFGTVRDLALARSLSWAMDLSTSAQLAAVSRCVKQLTRSPESWHGTHLTIDLRKLSLKSTSSETLCCSIRGDLIAAWKLLQSFTLICSGCAMKQVVQIQLALNLHCPTLTVHIRGSWDLDAAGSQIHFGNDKGSACIHNSDSILSMKAKRYPCLGSGQGACVTTNHLLPYFPGHGYYFEANLCDFVPMPHPAEALALLGVTTTAPGRTALHSAYIWEIPHTFCLLPRGELCVDGKGTDQWIRDFRLLDVRDKVGFLVTVEGDIVLYRQTRFSGCEGPQWHELGRIAAGVPSSATLYGVVQMCWNLLAVDLSFNGVPPSGCTS